jgi:hypothetical protein
MDDSTSVRTISVRLESPVSSAALSFVTEASMTTPMGWSYLASSMPRLDTTKLIARPGTSLVAYRTAAILRFVQGISDQAKQTFFSQNGLSVIGVQDDGTFYVSFSDPGQSIEAFDAIINGLRSKPELMVALEIYRTGLEERDAARYPVDQITRADWFSQSSSLWAMRAVRAPLAWGCENGTYSTAKVRVGLVEWVHDKNHPEFATSSPVLWAPSEASLSSQPAPASLRNRDYRHAAATGGLLTAAGDNGSGMAGVSWRTQLFQYSLRSPLQRSLLPNLRAFLVQVEKNRPRVLSFSVDVVALNAPFAYRQGMILQWATQIGALLDSVPSLTVVVAAGNDRIHTTVANYITLPDAGLIRSALLSLRLMPQYRDRILVVIGTIPGNSFWNTDAVNPLMGSNSFEVADIGAPAANVGTIDTVRTGQPVGFYQESGTSLSAPMVAGAAALLLAMDSTLTPAQVKDYLIRGARVARDDSSSGNTIAASPVQGVPNASVYQLDLYGSLTLLSKERAGTPICGYALGTWYTKTLYFYKNGVLSSPTDTLTFPEASDRIANPSVAPGGRKFALYVPSNVSPFSVTKVYSHTGQLLETLSGVWRRFYLERDIVDYSAGTVKRYRPNSPIVSKNLTCPDGSEFTTGLDARTASPDGRYFTFSASNCGGLNHGLYVFRFDDLVTELIHGACNCRYHDPIWSHDGRKVVIPTREIETYPPPEQILPFSVAVTGLSGTFSPLPALQVGEIHRGTFSPDNAVLYTVEWLNGAYLISKRPSGNLTVVAAQVTRSSSLGEIGFQHLRARP